MAGRLVGLARHSAIYGVGGLLARILAVVLLPLYSRNPASTSDLLTAFDANVARARQKIAEQTDASLAAVWTMKKDGHEMFSMPRMSALRNLVMNHSIHHRGQLTVYLRLRNVPLPALYGPTADEG